MKWYGKIGFAETKETVPGVWESLITERTYYGELVRNARRIQAPNQVNDDVTVTNEISVLADPYATHNFHAIRYAEFMGVKWTVSNVTVQYPRLVLSLGGVYNA